MKFPRRQLLALAPFAALSSGVSAAKKNSENFDVAKELNLALESGSGSLELPAGRFKVSPLLINKPFTLTGVEGQTILVASQPGPVVSIRATKGVFIAGIIIEGIEGPSSQNDKAGLIEIVSVENVSVTKSSFVKSNHTGIVLEKSSGEISSCLFSSLGQFGIKSDDGAGLNIFANKINNMGNGGIAVWQSKKASDGSRIIGNIIANIRADAGGSGEYGNGINVFRAANVLLSNNYTSDCAFSGIRCNAADNSQILGNTLLRSRETALYSEFSFEGSIISNNIVDGGSAGISIANFREGGRLSVCTSNIVRNLRRGTFQGAPEGNGIYAEADTIISNNIIEGADAFGIGLGWGPYCRNVTAQGNTIRNVGRAIIFSDVEGTGHVSIIGNMIDNPNEFSIVGMRWDKVTTPDFMATSEKPPARVVMYGNVLTTQK